MEMLRSEPYDRHFAVDTTFVLFFLAVDLGQSLASFGIDTLFSALTVAMLAVLPYYLPSSAEKPDFAEWLLGRSVIAIFAIVLGAMFRQALGVVLPETFSYFPMTLVILTAVASCYLQLCAMIKFRLAR
jgi:hypothetical protein